MMYLFYLLGSGLLVIAQALYLWLARRFGVVDRPNERSMHNTAVVRGGGILVWLAALLWSVGDGFSQPDVFAGLTLVAAVSFADDLRPVAVRYRLLVQAIAVAVLLRQMDYAETGLLSGLAWLLIGVSVLNAWNFMDGINGMTALYGLVTIGTLWLLSNTGFNSLFVLAFLALGIFGYCNVRQRAVCFAGDVGSISVGFVVLVGIVQLVVQTQSYLPFLLLAVYGVDTVFTIGHRLWLRQNIFQAHRLHLFQLLVYRGGWSHVGVSVLYALTQACINTGVWWMLDKSTTAQIWLASLVLVSLSGIYVVLKQRLQASKAAPAFDKFWA